MAKQYKVGIYCRLSVDDASNSAKAKGYIPSDESASAAQQEDSRQEISRLRRRLEELEQITAKLYEDKVRGQSAAIPSRF